MKDSSTESTDANIIKDTRALSIDWFTNYTRLSEDLDYLIKILNIFPEKQQLEMPRINGPTIAEIISSMTPNQIDNAVHFFIKIILDLECTPIKNMYGNHLDLALDNVIVSKNRFILVDPDSFEFKIYFDYVNYNKLFSKLLQILEEQCFDRKQKIFLDYDKIMDNMQSNTLDDGSAKKSFFDNKEFYISKYSNNN